MLKKVECMMKKMLVFLIVLGLVSTVNASIVTVKAGGSSGTVQVTAGATVEITLVNVDTTIVSGYTVTGMGETTTSAAGHVMALSAGRAFNAGFTLTKTLGNVRNAMTTATATSLTNRYILLDRSIATVNTGDPAISTGTTLFTFSVVVPTAGTAGDKWIITPVTGLPVFTPPTTQYLHQIDTVNVGTTNAVTLYIPEPMTIALLGLGGLFLRRRR